MNTRQIRSTSLAIVAAALAGMVALITLVLFIGMNVDVDADATAQGNTRASFLVLMFGTVVMVGLFAVFLYAGVEDKLSGLPLSRLYWPQASVKGAMAAYMLMVGPVAFDFFSHNLQPTWPAFYTPVAKIFQSLLLLCVFASFAWVLVTLLRGRAQARAQGSGRLDTILSLARRLRRVERRQDTQGGDLEDHEERLATTEEVVSEVKETIKKIEPSLPDKG